MYDYGLSMRVALVLSCALFGGCNGAVWGNLAVLGITFGIFLGTLSLGRARTLSRDSTLDRNTDRTKRDNQVRVRGEINRLRPAAWAECDRERARKKNHRNIRHISRIFLRT